MTTCRQASAGPSDGSAIAAATEFSSAPALDDWVSDPETLMATTAIMAAAAEASAQNATVRTALRERLSASEMTAPSSDAGAASR